MNGPIKAALFIITLVVTTGFVARAQDNAVDVALVIAVDCSYSVDATEFDLQRQGLAAAFRNPQIIEAIKEGTYGRIAVSVIQWSSSASQVVAVPWLMISDEVSANVFAQAASTMPRQTAEGGTSISAAITASLGQLQANPFQAQKLVIDIQADGTNNNGPVVDQIRDHALSFGVTINGLTILNEVPWLHFYFRNHVIGGPGAFVEIANDYAAYGRAIEQKILKEIAPPKLF